MTAESSADQATEVSFSLGEVEGLLEAIIGCRIANTQNRSGAVGVWTSENNGHGEHAQGVALSRFSDTREAVRKAEEKLLQAASAPWTRDGQSDEESRSKFCVRIQDLAEALS